MAERGALHGSERSMRSLAFAARAITAVNVVIGNIFSWLALGIVLVCFAVVIERYVFSVSHVWMQDLYVWLNGAMFTAIAGYALLRGDHVRVDVFYRPARARTKAIIDLVGSVLFLFPFAAVVVLWSWSFVRLSWLFKEGSPNTGGMPGLFILKSFIIVFAGVIALQGVAMVLRSIIVLAGREDLLPQHLRYGQG